MAVRYRFKSELNFSKIDFDGAQIYAADVKSAIYQQRKLGRSENDLKITNSENGEEYCDEAMLIPKNTSLIVVRVPGISSSKNKNKKFQQSKEIASHLPKISFKNLQMDLTKMTGSEEEKIYAMMMQSTVDYNARQQNYGQFNSHNFSNPPPSSYVCRRCKVPGHWIQKCSLAPLKSTRFDPTSKMTGIPMSMRHQSSEIAKIPKSNEHFNKENFKTLSCEICKEIFRNPTRTPCCRKTFCYDCIESSILNSDEHECPTCGEKYLMLSQLEVNEEIGREIFKIKC